MGYKLLIVDDEPLIRQGIKAKVNWSTLGIDAIDEANDGLEALEKLISFNPNIIITDIKMPEMDGLQFIEAVFKKQHMTQFIIISGYAEFAYAQKGLSLGVKEYILKPIDPKELEKTIEKVVQSINEESKKTEKIYSLEKEIEKAKAEEIDRKFSEILYAPNSGQNIKNKFFEQGVCFNKEYFIISILAIKNHTNKLDLKILKKTLDGFSVKAIPKEMTSFKKNVVYFKNSRIENEYILIFNLNMPDNSHIFTLMQQFIKILNERLELYSAIGISSTFKDICFLRKAYNEAKIAVSESQIRGLNKVFLFNDLKDIDTAYLDQELSKKVLFTYLEDRSKEEVVRYIEGLFARLSQNKKFNHFSLRKVCLEIYMCAKDFLAEHHQSIDTILGEISDFMNELLSLEDIHEISSFIKDSLLLVMNHIQIDKKFTGQDIVNEVIRIIRNNYTKELSLNFISKKYYINPNYFSRIFKEIAGKSFNDYITYVRINKALELMSHTSLNISHISRLVGYEEPKYFSKVFKKEIGVSPSEYMDKMKLHSSQ